MASEDMSSEVKVDKYRTFLHEDAKNNNIVWRHGAPPVYDDVNKLFEEGRTMEWAKGSLEEIVQNAIKSWEMELSHKARLQDFRTINPHKFKLFVNGRQGLSGEEALKIGSYNALLKTSLPKSFQYYKAEEESFESSHEVFRSAFPRGFAWEVICVYSGPPNIAFKFRHWGFFEGPFKAHAPTGNMVEFYGLGIVKVGYLDYYGRLERKLFLNNEKVGLFIKNGQKVDESLLVEDVEIYYDPAELFGGLLKEPVMTTSLNQDNRDANYATSQGSGCPFGH